MRVCYADPPYLGKSMEFYGEQHLEAAIYDTVDGHRALIGRLREEFPDGWAMSLHSPSLKVILPLCPADCRVAAWVKPFCSFKLHVNPAYTWEPVIFRGGRKRTRQERTVRDYCAASAALKKGFRGAKPEGFCFWVFELLGLQPSDEFVDLFPGSGAVGRAWETYQRLFSGLFPALVDAET